MNSRPEILSKNKVAVFLAVFAATIVLNAYNLTNFEISADDEFHFMSSSADVSRWWFSIGRWAAGLIALVTGQSFVAPFSTILFFCLGTSISYTLICDIHGVNDYRKRLLLLTLFAVFPTWAFIESFYSVLPAVTIGLILSSAAAYFTIRIIEVPTKSAALINISLAVLCLVVAIGCYQSFVIYYIAAAIGSWIYMNAGSHVDKSKSLKRLIYPFAIAFVCVGISQILSVSFQLFFSVPPSQYLESMLNLKTIGKETISSGFGKGITIAISYYSGDSNYYGYSLRSFALLVFASFFALIRIINASRHVGWKITTIIAYIVVMLVPFAFFFLGGDAPTRTLVSLPYIFWLMGAILLKQTSRWCARALESFLIGIVGLVIIELVFINGAYSAASYLSNRYDIDLASQIYSRVASLRAGDDPDLPVSIGIKGKALYMSPIPTGEGSTIGVSIFDWDDGNQYRGVALLNMLGYQEVDAMSPSDLSRFEADWETMSQWPLPNSVKRVGPNRFLVKLRDEI